MINKYLFYLRKMYILVSVSGGKSLELTEDIIANYEYLKILISFREKANIDDKYIELEKELFDFISENNSKFTFTDDNEKIAISDFLGFELYIDNYPKRYNEIINNYKNRTDVLLKITSDLKPDIDNTIVRNIKSDKFNTDELDYVLNITKEKFITNNICDKLSKYSNNVIIAGGSALGSYKNLISSDIDLFIYNDNGFNIKEFMNDLINIDDKLIFLNIIESQYAYTIEFSKYDYIVKIQLIRLIYKSINDIIREFDVDCCSIARKLSVEEEYYTTERGWYSISNNINHFNILFLSPTYEKRQIKYVNRSFDMFLPFYDYFIENMETNLKSLKGLNIITLYINDYASFYKSYNNYDYYGGNQFSSNIELPYEFKFEENNDSKYNEFMQRLTNKYEDYYPKKRIKNILIKPSFKNEVIKLDNNIIYDDTDYYNTESFPFKSDYDFTKNFEELKICIENFMKKTNGDYLIFGDIAFSLYTGNMFKDCTNINIYKNVNKNQHHQINYNDQIYLFGWVNIHNEYLTIEDIMNTIKYDCKKILLKYNKLSNEFEYYATDECLWYIQHKLFEFPQFKERYMEIGLKHLKGNNYINANNLETRKDKIYIELN